MIAKSVLFVAIFLLIKETTSLRCYQCADYNMEDCNSDMRSVLCEDGYDRCFKFWGSIPNNIGESQPHAEKGCGIVEACNILTMVPGVNTIECSVCKGNNCNTSSMITTKPLLVVVLFAIASKVFG